MKKLLSTVISITLLAGSGTAVSAEEAIQTEKRNIILGAGHITGYQQSNIYYGTYQQSNAGKEEPAAGVEGIDWIKSDTAVNNGYGPYYYIDPVKWRVLSVSGDTAFLFIDKIIESKAYNETSGYIYWNNCTIRSWLNGYSADSNDCNIDYTNSGFINSVFSLREAEYMEKTKIDGVEDYLYLLSYDEATNTEYGFAGAYDTPNNRETTYSDYHNGANLGGNWVLNDVPRYPCDRRLVWAESGVINYTTSTHFSQGVRPAFRLSLSEVLFTSGTADDGYALTFKDEERTFAVSDLSERITYPGGKAEFEYTNAATGSNEYISAIILNSENEVLDYTQIAQPSAESGTAEYTVPDNIPNGEYTLMIFNEQYNGEGKTSFSSDIEVNKIPLTLKDVTEFEKFEISSKAAATVVIPAKGTYTVIFADYENGRLNMVDEITRYFDAGETTVISETDIELGSGDKIMLWSNLSEQKPMCGTYVIN